MNKRKLRRVIRKVVKEEVSRNRRSLRENFSGSEMRAMMETATRAAYRDLYRLIEDTGAVEAIAYDLQQEHGISDAEAYEFLRSVAMKRQPPRGVNFFEPKR
jgi:hypothetical protein